MMNDVDILNNKIIEISQTNLELENENKSLKDKNKDLSKRLKKLELNSSSNMYEKQLQDLSLDYSKLENKYKSYQFNLEQKEKQIAELKKGNVKVKEIESSFQAKIKELENSLAAKDKEIQELQSRTLDDELEYAKKQTHQMEIERNQTNLILQDTKEKLECVEKENAELKSQIQEKENDIIKEKEALAKEKETNENLQKELNNIKSQLSAKTLDLTLSQKAVAFNRSLVDQAEKEKNEIIESHDKVVKELKKEIDELKNQLLSKSRSLFSGDQISEIYSDNLFFTYQKNYNISFKDLIEKTIINFDFIIEGAFNSCYHGNVVAPLTIFHDNIKDIFYTLFSRGLLDKQKNKQNTQEEIANVDMNDISNETLNKIANDFFELNIVSRSLESSNEKVENYINQMKNLNLSDDDMKNIADNFKKKSEKEKTITIKSIINLLEKCTSLIHNGSLEWKKEILFDFKSTYNSQAYNISKGNLFVDLSKLNNRTVDGLINLIKYPPEKIIKIQLVNNYDYTKLGEVRILKLFLSLIYFQPSILSFSITDCQNMTEDIIKYLVFYISYLKSIKILNLENDKINDQQIKVICEALKRHKTIIAIFLNKNDIHSDGLLYLADCLSLNKSIDRIYLSQNNIRGNGLNSLLNTIIDKNKKINCLDLSNNTLQLTEYEIISDFLKKNPDLNSLSLNDNFIDSKGSFYIGSGLAFAKNLKILNLSNMNIDPDFTASLFNKLLYIEELYLDNNQIKDTGMLALGKSLIGNNALKKISLKNTKFSCSGIASFLNLTRECSGLRQIHLENNEIDDTITEFLITFLAGKKNSIKFYLSSSMINDKQQKDMFAKLDNFVLV